MEWYLLPWSLCGRRCLLSSFFFFNDTATTEIYTLSLHDALPILHQVAIGDERVHRHQLDRGDAERSEERFSRNAETDIVCRLLLGKKRTTTTTRALWTCVFPGGRGHSTEPAPS